MIDWNTAIPVAGTIVGAVTGALAQRWLERRPKVVAFLAHATAIPMPQRQLTVSTHSVVIRNAGRRTATNVRVGHLELPDFSVWPPRPHAIEEVSGMREIVFPQIVAGDQVTISYLYVPPLVVTDIHAWGEQWIRHDEGLAKIADVLPIFPFSRLLQATLKVLLLLGFVTAVYLGVRALLWLVAVNSALATHVL